MSKYKIKEDINQPRLIGFLKGRNNSGEGIQEVTNTYDKTVNQITPH